METHNKYTSSDTIHGDKFQQQGNNNKMVIGKSQESRTRLILILVVAPVIVGLVLLAAEYFGFMHLTPYKNSLQEVRSQLR